MICALSTDAHEIPESELSQTGHAATRSGARICNACSYEVEIADFRANDNYFGYVDSDEQYVTTWLGGKLGKITNIGRGIGYTPTGGYFERIYITVADIDGRTWHGRGPGGGMYVRLRLGAADKRNRSEVSA